MAFRLKLTGSENEMILDLTYIGSNLQLFKLPQVRKDCAYFGTLHQRLQLLLKMLFD